MNYLGPLSVSITPGIHLIYFLKYKNIDQYCLNRLLFLFVVFIHPSCTIIVCYIIYMNLIYISLIK